MKTWFWVVVASLALLTGCGGVNGNFGHVSQYPSTSPANSGAYTPDGSNQVNFDVPIQLNKQVKAYLVYFSTKRKGVIQRQLDRSTRYLPMIKRIFREYGLPDDLAYLAMIESGFNPRACSPAGAKGMWQFIKGTGRRYGLVINRHVDQRFDPEKSTRAAARYLRDLYEQFGSWYLAAASYNCGERRVERELRKSSYRNFWQLSANRCLPNETKNYVPQLIAATIIAKNPGRFGFNNPPGFRPSTIEKTMLASNNGIGPTEERNFARASIIPTPSPNRGHSYSLFGRQSSVQAYVARKPKTQRGKINGKSANTATYARGKRKSGVYVASLFGYPSPAPRKVATSKYKTKCRLARSPKKKNRTLTMSRKSKKSRRGILTRRSKPRHHKFRVARHKRYRKHNRKLARSRHQTYLASRAW